MTLLPQDLLNALSAKLKAQNKLEEISYLFINKHNLKITIGAELEFYLSENINPEEFSELLKIKIKKEKGINQFEIDLPPSSNFSDYAYIIEKTKEKILNTALLLNGNAFLSPKAFIDDYGNSMHIHISFDKTTEELLYKAAKSLCHFMLKTCLVFLPTEEDYLRLNKEFMAPTHVSFGNNNRSVAVRIPNLMPKRLEHRLPSLASDPYLVIFSILKSILIGLNYSNQIEDFPKIYGNAYDNQYSLKALPKSINESLAYFDSTFFNNDLTIL